jgi:uncharacterized protein (TIGR02285 family)
MQKMLMLLVFMLICSLLQAKESKTQLNWAINTAPPFHIVSGPFARQGLCDQLLQSIEKQLPEQKHQQILMPQTRIHQSLNKKEQLCFPCMIHKSQPTETAVYSNITHWYRPQGLITRQELAEQLSRLYGSPLPLEKALKNPAYQLGLAAGRRYGPLEQLLAPYREKGLIRSGDDSPVALLKMIQTSRIDFTLDYDIILTYLRKTAPQQAKGLVFLAIAELSDPVPGAIGCSNSDWGQQQIQQINKVLPQLQADPQFRHSLELWFESPVLPAVSTAQP